MALSDESRRVLAYIGPDGKMPDQIDDEFPGHDMRSLQNHGYVQLVRIVLTETTDTRGEVGSPLFRYVLTAEGAREAGIDPALLR